MGSMNGWRRFAGDVVSTGSSICQVMALGLLLLPAFTEEMTPAQASTIPSRSEMI